MFRATPVDTSFRSYSGGGCRTCIDTVDDSKLMQETNGARGMKGESWPTSEAPQNYGFTSVVAPATKDGQGNILDCAEGFMQFMGGNRNFPVCGVMDDRRHRLKGLKPGDSAMYRQKDDGRQFHLTDEGGYWSDTVTTRMQLVSQSGAPQQQRQQQQGGQQQPASGATGQNPVYKNGQKSMKYVDVTSDRSRVSGKNSLLMLEDGNGYVHASDDKQVWLGMEKGKASFARVLTEDGIAVNVWAKLGAGPLPNMCGGNYAEVGAQVEPPKKLFFAKTADVEALVARVEAMEARLAALERNHPILFWFLKRAL
jgi:hypothetical protein